MSLTVRRRGTIWHARGTVRIGRETITVGEFSTGATSRPAAIEVAEREAARIRADHVDGAAGRARRLTVADCLDLYERQHGSLQPYDLDRIAKLNDVMGGRALADTAAGWQDWLRLHPAAAPATVQRWRTILAAALRAGCEAHQIPAPKLPAVRLPREQRLVFLSAGERRRLLASYTPHAACPVLLLAYQGMRTQEVLRLDWRTVDLTRDREAIHIPAAGTKSGRGRTVPMHARVRMLLVGMWEAAGRPDTGPVFRSSRRTREHPQGAPYTDTRGVGGNPLRQPHDTACERAGVVGFRVHDWRHDWSARHVMGGTDLVTLMQLGGWSSLRMVEKYASVTGEHLRDAVRRVA